MQEVRDSREEKEIFYLIMPKSAAELCELP